jgi:hypothetical protein
MNKVTYSTRFSTMVREFDTLPEAERYAGGLIKAMRRVNIMITSLTVNGTVII